MSYTPPSVPPPNGNATRHFQPDQWVRVLVSSSGKSEIGKLKSIDGESAVVETGSGFDIKVKRSQLSRVFLLILDLNGVLVNRNKKKTVYKRPYVDEFLEFALKNFVVGVWSSCMPENGHDIVDKTFGKSQKKLHFQMYRDQCTPNPTPENKYGTRKDLIHVWAQYPKSFNEENTIIIDDSPEKCSHPNNAFCPPSYAGRGDETDIAQKDTGLLQVIQVLKQVLETDSLEPVRVAKTVTMPSLCVEEMDEDEASGEIVVLTSPKGEGRPSGRT